jgi:hypothetical protein
MIRNRWKVIVDKILLLAMSLHLQMTVFVEVMSGKNPPCCGLPRTVLLGMRHCWAHVFSEGTGSEVVQDQARQKNAFWAYLVSRQWIH